MIEIVPDILEYKPPFTNSSIEYVSITNKGEESIAFKVKTTAPKIYCVRPNAAIVAPGEQVKIQVILLGLSEEPAPDFKCRDKFLLITLPAPYDLGESTVAEAWPQLESEFKDQSVSKKIKVKYLLNGPQSNEAIDTAATDEVPVSSAPSAVTAAVPAVAAAPAAAKAPVAAPAAPAAPAPAAKTSTTKPNTIGDHVARGSDHHKKANGDSGAVNDGGHGSTAARTSNVSRGDVASPASSVRGSGAAAAACAGTGDLKAPIPKAQENVPIFNPALVLIVALLALVLGWLYY